MSTTAEFDLRPDEHDDLRRALEDERVDRETDGASSEPGGEGPTVGSLGSELYADLVAALGQLENILARRSAEVETRSGGSFSYSYAGLADVLDRVRPVLAARGLALIQPLTTDVVAGTVTIPTRLLHRSGQEYTLGVIVFPLGQTAQQTGSAITYARRYAILAALGIAGSTDDDDGATAAPHRAPESPPARVSGARAPRGISKAQHARLGAVMDEAGVPADAEVRRGVLTAIIGRPVHSRSDLTATEATVAIDAVARSRWEPGTDDSPGVLVRTVPE